MVRIDPKNTEAHLLRGIQFNDRKSDYDKAIEDYNAVIELEPNHSAAYNNRCVSYRNKRRL